MTIQYDYTYVLPFIKQTDIESLRESVKRAHQMLHEKTGPGSDFLGWINLPHNYDKDEFKRIKQAAERIQQSSETLVVIGIGGSYLGAKAVVEALQPKNAKTKVYFAGNNLSPSYISSLLEQLADKDVSINVVSKSGTTTEPAIAFRIFRELLEKKYGSEGAKQRIYVTTDHSKGALRKFADEEGYETFVIPDDIGGRYSVLTAVGLLPIAAAGIDVDQVLAGAAAASDLYNNEDLSTNEAYQYAAVRNVLYNQGKTVELLVSYEPSFHYVAEWWKQLFGESEGKDHKGLFPGSVQYSTDLHSLGQYVQEGMRNLTETVIQVKKPITDIVIASDPANIDGLNFLAGKTLDEVNKKAFMGTLIAHVEGGVPNSILKLDELNEYTFGEMIYFFEKACGISGHLLGVNPFNQPGVEAYKQNMFALLDKPGFEDHKAELEKHLPSL